MHPQIKLQRFRKLWIWTFGWLVYRINSLYEVLRLKQNFRKNKVVAAKTPFFVIGQFYTPPSICLNIEFWQSSFVWECCAFILSIFKRYSSYLKRLCVFQKICFKIKEMKTFKTSSDCHVKTWQSLKRRVALKVSSTVCQKNLCSLCRH